MPVTKRSYDCRDEARRLMGEAYPDIVARFGPPIAELSAQQGLDHFDAAQALLSKGGGFVGPIPVAAAFNASVRGPVRVAKLLKRG